MIQTFYVSIAPACSLEMRIICILPWEQHKSLVRPNVRSLGFLNGIHKANGQPMARPAVIFTPGQGHCHPHHWQVWGSKMVHVSNMLLLHAPSAISHPLTCASVPTPCQNTSKETNLVVL